MIIAFLSGVLLALLGTLFVHRPAPALPEKTKPAFGLDDKDILLYVEAITRIKENASYLSPDVTRMRIVEESLRAFLAQKPRCCDYLTREEYRKFQESLQETYVGIGMEIKQGPDGRIISLPHPESPAARAGIAPGDELKRIDGISVEGKSVFAVAGLARGKPGTEVVLTTARRGGAEKKIRITRSAVALQSVSRRVVDRRPVIALSHFTRDTTAKIREIVKNWDGEAPIIIDLRGNGGGDLHGAIDSAMLFLKEGRRIVSIESRKGTSTYESSAAPINLTTPMYLWQDEGTASAAEVFIAALTDNQRAVSIGRRSAGKATREEIIGLSDGSALILATGSLRTPKGLNYEGTGLKPMYELRPSADDSTAYMMKVQELAGAQKSGWLGNHRGPTVVQRSA
jgi:carboxyl-terminal processing protease